MNFENKSVFVTGGSGFFGSAYLRFLLAQNCKKVICFSRGWQQQQLLRDALGDPTNFRWFIGDIRDKERLERAIKDIDIVIHAGALKCLHTCEYNPTEALATNVIGSQNVIDVCIDKGVNKCLLISSDKAVEPINTYGATKTLAEKLWLNANKYAANDDVRFSVCRYGNVSGSSGSVLPIYKKLILEGAESLPVTDKEMTRFWFQMEDVLQFVTKSLEDMKGGEIFIPELPSVRIVDICEAFGFPYHLVGIRPGEKLHETMGTGFHSGNNPSGFLTVEEIKKTIQNAEVK